MRVPKRFAVGTLAALIALAATGLGVGCATSGPVAIVWDQREDLSRFRTWDWIEGDAVLVRAPTGNEDELQARLSALVATTLRERGLERAPGSGEIRVAALLVVHRSYQAITRTRAMQTLHSNHDVGSYEVEAQEMERRPLDRIRLSVYVTGARQERVLWQGAFAEQYPGGFAAHLDDAIASLLAEFPPRVDAAGATSAPAN
jgi:hypothetical protein